VGSPSLEELRDEQRRLRQVRFIVDLTTSILMQGDLTRMEGENLVAGARARILGLFPGRDATYEILYARRFAALLDTCTRSPDAATRGRVLSFPTRDAD
jgi:hypothetical protein